MVFQPVLVVVLLEIAILELAYIGYSAYGQYTRSWDPVMLYLAVGSVFGAVSLGATALAMGDIVTTSWDVIIGGALSLVLGLGLLANAFHGYDVGVHVTTTRDGLTRGS